MARTASTTWTSVRGNRVVMATAQTWRLDSCALANHFTLVSEFGLHEKMTGVCVSFHFFLISPYWMSVLVFSPCH